MAAFRQIEWSLTATMGIAGLLADGWPALLPWPASSLHIAFGMLLLATVVTNFRRGISGTRLDPPATRALCRRLSRSVYLVSYLVFGIGQIIRAGWNAAASGPPENLRDYLAYGLLALLTIHALAAISARRRPTPQMNPRLASAEGVVAPP